MKNEIIINNLKEQLLNEECEKSIYRGDLEKKSREFEELEKEYNQIISQLEEKNEKIKELNEEIDELLDENDCLNQENCRMTKILIEKNNSERNITPKKEKTGYVLQGIQEVISSYKSSQDYDCVNERLECWEYRIETPYKLETQPWFRQVRMHITRDLLFGRLNLFELSSSERDVEISEEIEKDEPPYKNYAFDIRGGMNPRTGYWYIIFRTLYEIKSELLSDL